MSISAPGSTTGSSTPTRSSAFGHHLRDTATMLGRSLRLSRRDPDEIILSLLLPVAIMVLFVYVFGGAMEVGTDYVTYATPGVILLCAGYGASNTAITIATDMSGGIMDRFRSMPIATGSVLAGHIIASVGRNLLTTAVVVGVATAIGFRAEPDFLAWAAAIAVVTAYVFAITCVAAFVGVIVRSPAAAGGLGFAMLFLPYVSSAFAPPETMPGWLRGFAENQPVTPIIEAIRGLAIGLGSDAEPVTGLGSTVTLALLWCAAIAGTFLGPATWAFRRRKT